MPRLRNKALLKLGVVKVPIFQGLMWVLVLFLDELQSKHWYTCMLSTRSPMERSLSFQPS